MDIIERLNASLSGRYAIDRRVGEGGMATVYLAHDQKHDRKVALKVLKPALVASLGRDRFLREITVTANLQHPHILPLFDSGEADGLLFYVMPYVDEESLRERLARGGKLPISEAVRLLRDVVGGLAAAHRFGVVHQDIKPGNVLISGRRAIVADFGVARAVTQATEQNTRGPGRDNLGSPAYTSPEQASGSANVDHRADIYAVGCLAYHMLVGWPPFHGRTPRQTLTAHVVEDVAPLSEARPSVPPELAALVTRCLQKDPADRWQSVDEILDQLEGVITSDHDVPPLRPSARGRRLLANVAGIVVVVAAAVAAALYVSGPNGGSGLSGAQDSAELPRDYVAVFPFENLTGETGLDHLGTLAAYIVTDGVAQLDGLRAASEPAVVRAAREAEDEGVLKPAAQLGAGIAVTGVYSLNGTILEFRAEIFAVPGGELIRAVEASGSTSDPQPILTELQRRTLGALSQDVLGRGGTLGVSAMVPTLGALEVFLQGRRAFNDGEFARALPFLYHAFELDTMFLDPLAVAASANINVGRYAAADSLVDLVQARRELLSSTGLQYLEWSRSLFTGDVETQLRSVRRLAETYGTDTWIYLLGNTALHAGKPMEARQALAQLEGDIVDNWYFATSRLSRANQATGRYQEALDVARRGRQAFPEVLVFNELELRALVRLDRLDEIDPLLDAVATRGDWRGPAPGMVLLRVATELARAGRLPEARSTGDRALRWYVARDREENRAAIAQIYILLDRGPEALALLAPLALESPEDIRLRGMHAVALALSGDRLAAEGALDWLETLERPYTFGTPTYWRAATLAHLGQEAESVRALTRAFEEGHSHLLVRVDPNLSPLWGFEPFEQAIAPAG